MMRSNVPGPRRNPSAVTAGTPMAGTSVRTIPKIATSAAPLRVNNHAETTTSCARSTVRTPATAICAWRSDRLAHTARVRPPGAKLMYGCYAGDTFTVRRAARL